jgi:3-oxoacyl-[acyl-carrier-protein] synthase II
LAIIAMEDAEQTSLVTKFAKNAVREAWSMSGLTQSKYYRPDDIGVYFAAGESGLPFPILAKRTSTAWQADSSSINMTEWVKLAKDLSALQVSQSYPQHTLNAIANEVGAEGYVSNCLTACAASLQAIGEATELIRLGEAKVMVAGGANRMLHELGFSGFNRLGTLSTRNDSPQAASRPFDSQRDGFVLGEGAGAVVLESLESALARKATILAEIAGYASTSDAYRVTDQHPESDGLVRAMQLAIRDANIEAGQIDYLNAHGTGTTENDRQETKAIHRVFGDYARKLPISSIKGMVGHLLTAAGVVEFIATTLALRDQRLPPTVNLTNPDLDCDLDYVPNHSRDHETEIAMTVNTGFGGLNDAIVLRSSRTWTK